MKTKIMAHMVAYYPSQKGSVDFAKALIDGGASYLEVQFPFSDPTLMDFSFRKHQAGLYRRGLPLTEVLNWSKR